MVRHPLRSFSSILPWVVLQSVVFLLLWQVLLLAQNPSLMSDDSGEMIAASFTLGLPHPPGYPLYCLLGKIFSWVPLGSVAFRFNLLSSMAGLLALGFVLDTLRRLSEGEGSAALQGTFRAFLLPAFLTLTLFFDRSFFSQALSAKGLVYILSFLLISILVWHRVRREREGPPSKTGRGLYPILFLFCLGFTNHWQTFILLVPFMAVWHFQEKNRWRLKNTLVSASLGLTALSLYLYLPLRSALNIQTDWGEPSTLTRFLWVVLRKLAVTGEAGEEVLRGWDHYRLWGGEYLRIMGSSFWPGFWLVVLAGVLWFWSKERRLAVSFLACYLPLLAGMLTVPRDETLFLLGVYLLPLQGILALFAFYGLAFLFKTLFEMRWWLAPVLGCFLALTLLQHAAPLLRAEDKSRYTLASDLGVNALKDLPRGALFLAEGDHMLMPIWYERSVRGSRPDLLFQPAPFLLHDWGWRQLADQDGVYEGATLPGQTFGQRLAFLAKGPRPLFYSLDRYYLGEELGKMYGTFTPAGLVLEWGKGKPASSRVSQRAMRSEAGRRLRGVPEYRAGAGRDISSEEILHYYAQAHYLVANLLYAEGGYWPAVKHLALGIEYQPRAGAYGNLSALLGKLGHDKLAAKYSRLADLAQAKEAAGPYK